MAGRFAVARRVLLSYLHLTKMAATLGDFEIILPVVIPFSGSAEFNVESVRALLGGIWSRLGNCQ
jgi:hypothetical protein